MNRIRLATAADGVRLAEIYRPAIEETGVSFEEIAPDGAEMAERILTVLLRTPWVVAEVDGVITGYAYASRHRERPAYAWSTEASIYIDQTRHRTGVGRRLYTTLFEILALQGFQSVFAGVLLPNPTSAGFHRAMGFAEVGRYQRVGYKAGGWRDTLWFQRPIGSFPAPPAVVRSLPQLPQDSGLERVLAAAQW